MNERLMQEDDLLILNAVAQTIFNKKGFNILVLDGRKFSSLTDYIVIAEGSVNRHVISIAQAVNESLKELGLSPFYKEGYKTGDWVILDYFQFMVHVFTPGVREKYYLEELWREAEIVDVSIDVSSSLKETYSELERRVAF